jgi:DeoR/GlpR family transcriptional regulator of sugar metabolism
MAEAPCDVDPRPVHVFSSEPRLAILGLVGAQGRVRVRALSDQFGVSRQTISKDLAALGAQSRITPAHRWAISFQSRSIQSTRRHRDLEDTPTSSSSLLG